MTRLRGKDVAVVSGNQGYLGNNDQYKDSRSVRTLTIQPK